MFQVDNTAPPTADSVLDFWVGLHASYPKATVRASTLDAWAAYALSQKSTLPVVKQEIGDSWLYGSPADPYKLATFRSIRRTMSSTVSAEEAVRNPLIFDYQRRLLKCIERKARVIWRSARNRYYMPKR